MKKTISIFLVLICIQCVIAQKATVKWGKEIKTSKKSTLSDIVGYDETGFYTLKIDYKGRNSFILEHFDQNINRTKSVELVLKEQKKKLELESILQLDGELYVFSSFRNQKLKKKFLFVQSINKNSLTLKKDLRKIAEISYAAKRKSNSGYYGLELSRDSSQVLIYYKLPFDKGGNERFGFHVLDNQLEQIWEKKVTLPYKEELFRIDDYEISSKGDVYLLGRKYKDKAVVKRKGKPNYQYLILGYTNQGSEFNEYPVSVSGKFLSDMQIAINDDNNIICGGFYSDEGTFSIKGSYFLSIDGTSKKILTKSFKEFGINFITQNMTERQEKKAKKKKAKGKSVELYEYDLRGIILREDDGALLVGEQYFVRIYTSTYSDGQGNMRTVTNYQYHYNDIIVISISPEGQIEWTEKIPKRQITTNDGGFYSSFASSVVGDKIYFIYNDHVENLSLASKSQGKVKQFSLGKNSVVTLVEMDSDGRFTREALFRTQDTEVITRPKVCEQISNNEMIVFGQRKKIQRFAKVTFND